MSLRIWLPACLGLTILCLPLLAAGAMGQLKLVPWPAKITLDAGTFSPAKVLVLATAPRDAKALEVARTFAEDLRGAGFDASVQETAKPPPGAVALSLQADPALGEEGYGLTVRANGIAISANTDTGLFWSTRTVLQLLAAGPDKPVPCLTVADKPLFAYRGLLLDPARSFHSADFLIDTVRRLAACKMNMLQIHFSDNEGYRLPSKAFPKLPSVDASGKPLHYTEKEIAALVATAKKYHVTIVPEIEMPGHARVLSSVLAELRCNPQAAGAEICIGGEETYKTAEALISEVMEMIPGPYWHLGGDEASHVSWRVCPKCKKRMADEKLQGTPGLYNYFLNRMNTFVKSKGRRMMVWDGFNPKGDPVYHPHATMEQPGVQEAIDPKGHPVIVDKDVIVFPYDINLREGNRPMDYLDAGYTVVNASWKPLYVVPLMSVRSPGELAAWDAFQFKSYHDDGKIGAYPMTQPWVVKPTKQVLGAQMCSWDAQSEQRFLPGWLFNVGPDVANPWKIPAAPRVQIVAERLWTGSSTKPEDLLERLGCARP